MVKLQIWVRLTVLNVRIKVPQGLGKEISVWEWFVEVTNNQFDISVLVRRMQWIQSGYWIIPCRSRWLGIY